MDSDAVARSGEDEERFLGRLAPLAATEQHRNQAGGQFLGTNAIVLGSRGRCPAPLPGELYGNWLEIFGDPCTVDAGESENVGTTANNGADGVFIMRKRDCFEDGSVGVGNGHLGIVSPRARRKPVLRAPWRAQDHTKR